MQDLKESAALVTGASRGIGRAAALALAARGAAVALVGRDRDGLAATAEAVAGTGGQALALAGDVAAYADMERAARQAAERFGRLDILVNNAGRIEPIAPLAETDPADWARGIEVNLIGAYHAARAALPWLLRQGGAVVNISSGAAHRPLEGWSAYCAAKAGLALLTRSLALEYGPAGLRVFGFAPGVVDTGMQGLIRASGINEVSRLRRDQLAPPDQPARVIAWLCSQEAADLAGRELSIADPELRRRAGLPG